MQRRSTTRARDGDFLRICDRSGFTVWASDTVKEWDGAIVHKSFYEARHPQDLIRAPREKFGVPDARPDRSIANSNFTGPLITEIAQAEDTTAYSMLAALGQLALGEGDDGIQTNVAGATAISVDSTSGFSAQDRISIMMDSGDAHITTVTRVDSTTVASIADSLPGSVSVGNRVINYTATAALS